MIEPLQRFIGALREAGVRISPAEAIDAARAARAVGVEDRATFRAALAATLAKTRDESVLFANAFDAFFVAPAQPARRGKGTGIPSGAAGEKPPRRSRDQEPPPSSTAGSRRIKPDPPEPAKEEKPRRMRPGRLRVIRESKIAPRESREKQAETQARRPAPPRASEALGARHLTLRGRLSTDQEEALAREVPRLIAEIRLTTGRRAMRARRGRLWPARLMRSSVSTFGIPFVLPMRRRRPRQPRVVVLADVSWSVLRASAIFLTMARAFVHPGRRADVHLFVDRCVEATEMLRRWDVSSGATALAKKLESLPGLDLKGSSDFGRAFYQAAHAPRSPVKSARSGTILVVLGDARSNYRDPQAWAFEDLAARCRRVIWLNPEPALKWDTGDSVMSAYLPGCDVVCEARDLAGLARGVQELARSL